MSIADEIRAKITDGHLPVTRPTTVWVGFVNSAKCVACGHLIDRSRAYEFEAPERGLIAFDVECFRLWEAEIRRP
jgi:hypothetical protein